MMAPRAKRKENFVTINDRKALARIARFLSTLATSESAENQASLLDSTDLGQSDPTPNPVLKLMEGSLRLRNQRLNVPDRLRIFIDAAVTGEEAHAGDAGDGLGEPLFLVAVRLVDEVVGLAV